jgi:hypothetical protein
MEAARGAYAHTYKTGQHFPIFRRVPTKIEILEAAAAAEADDPCPFPTSVSLSLSLSLSLWSMLEKGAEYDYISIDAWHCEKEGRSALMAALELLSKHEGEREREESTCRHNLTQAN